MPIVAVIGAGRMGEGIARALHGAGWQVTLYARTPRDLPSLPVPIAHDLALATRGAEFVLLAVPDDAIESAGRQLMGALDAGGRVVLHLSGVRDRSALAELEGWATGLGSFWPLQTIPDPVMAPERLAGTFAGVEGDAPAVAAGQQIAAALGMTPVPIRSEGKTLAHAGAVVAGNYTITLLAAAERMARTAGVDPALAAQIYLPLVRTAVENFASLGAGAALTGPIRRGDVETIRRHLALLAGPAREIYRLLGLETVTLAEGSGLGAERAAELRRLLAE